MKYLPRAAAFGKLAAMVEGARLVRAELKSVSGLRSAVSGLRPVGAGSEGHDRRL
jgi:hypothetical protein